MLTRDEARRIAANIAKLPTYCARIEGCVAESLSSDSSRDSDDRDDRDDDSGRNSDDDSRDDDSSRRDWGSTALLDILQWVDHFEPWQT